MLWAGDFSRLLYSLLRLDRCLFALVKPGFEVSEVDVLVNVVKLLEVERKFFGLSLGR